MNITQEYEKDIESGCKVKLKISMDTECSSEQEMMEAIRFVSQSSHNFYMKAATEIRSTLS